LFPLRDEQAGGEAVSNDNEPIGYAIEPHRFRALQKMAAQLCGGTDRERDQGNLLHLIVREIEDNPIYDLKEKL
jgi:hypothetical protein